MATIVPIKKKSLTEKLSTLDKIANKMNQKFGKEIMGRIGQNEAIMDRLKITFIPTPCMDLNDAVGGGFPRRRCTILAGMPDSGKTSLVLETIALNMKEDPDFVACWLESENSLKKEFVCDTFDIDPQRFFFIEHDATAGAEQVLDVVQGILQSGSIDLFCINSLSCLVPTKEMEASLTDATIALQARMNSRLTRKFTPIVAEFDTAFIIVAHLSTMIGSMSRDPMVIAGGEAIKYWSSLTLDLRKRSIGPGEPIDKTQGIKIGVTVKKNHCIPERGNPYCKLEYYAIFGKGIEQILTSIDKAIDAGIIERHGAWLYWMDLASKDNQPYKKFPSRMAYREYMEQNPEEWKRFISILTGAGATGVQQLTEEEVADIKAEEEELDKIVADEKKSRK